MPRPLIIKIDSHKTQKPTRKATGSIDVNLLKENRPKLAHNREINHVSDKEPSPEPRVALKSVVRNLISKYESSDAPRKSNLLKYKSKSLVDLHYPLVSANDSPRTSQDDSLYRKKKPDRDEQAEEKAFDFRKIWSKFETSSVLESRKTGVVHEPVLVKQFSVRETLTKRPSIDEDDPAKEDPSLAEVKSRAKAVLDDLDVSNEAWLDRAIEVLHQIVDLKITWEDQENPETVEVSKTEATENAEDERSKSNTARVEVEEAPVVVENEDRSNLAKAEDGLEEKCFDPVVIEDSFAPEEEDNVNSRQEEALVVEAEEETFREEPEATEAVEETETGPPMKVKDIRSMFEVQSDDKVHVSMSHPRLFEPGAFEEDHTKPKTFIKQDTSPKVPLKYFGRSEEDENHQQRNPRVPLKYFGRSEEEEGDENEDRSPEEDRSMKIQEFKHLLTAQKTDAYVPYEDYVASNGANGEDATVEDYDSFSDDSSRSSQAEDVVEKRMIPAPMIVISGDGTKENSVKHSREELEELTKHIEDFDSRISGLSEENRVEGGYINEVLARILVRLDEVRTYGDEMIMSERRKALAFAHSCIGKLREKIQGV